MPILISNLFQQSPCFDLSFEDENQIITAIGQHDHLRHVYLQHLSSSLLEKLATMLQETFPTLTQVLLWASDDIDEIAPVIPEKFLGSAPLLEQFWLRGIPFPEFPNLLLSASNLVQLRLENIPDSGYFAPEALATSLSTCTKLEAFIIEFSSPYPHPDLATQQKTSIARSSLPALVLFAFRGNGGYLDKFFLGIENPLVVLGDTLTVKKYAHYEACITQSGFLFRFRSGYLEDLGSEEEELEEEEEPEMEKEMEEELEEEK